MTRAELSREAPLYTRPVYITLGKSGVLLFEGESPRSIPAARVKPPLDTVGAGDAFLSTLTASLAAHATPWEAGVLANLAAGVVVCKLRQTGTASPEEILGLFDRQGTGHASYKVKGCLCVLHPDAVTGLSHIHGERTCVQPESPLPVNRRGSLEAFLEYLTCNIARTFWLAHGHTQRRTRNGPIAQVVIV
ncbi:MAG: PfkB family carbohydrate kinase [Anaerolineae bacterium]|nr:PfkB family carbohydrate kinase [Anaerolineae bacterium]